VAGLAGTTALNAATYADMAMRGAVLLWQHGATFTGFPGRTGGRNPARGVRTAGGVTGGASR
jgi:hypothetical protein